MALDAIFRDQWGRVLATLVGILAFALKAQEAVTLRTGWRPYSSFT